MLTPGAPPLDTYLEHFGVKGMKWGVRKGGRPAKSPASSEATRKMEINQKAKRSGKKSLTNEELRIAIERMNLEQQWNRLRVNEQPAARRFVSSLLLDIGKQQVGNVVREKANEVVARKKSG